MLCIRRLKGRTKKKGGVEDFDVGQFGRYQKVTNSLARLDRIAGIALAASLETTPISTIQLLKLKIRIIDNSVMNTSTTLEKSTNHDSTPKTVFSTTTVDEMTKN